MTAFCIVKVAFSKRNKCHRHIVLSMYTIDSKCLFKRQNTIMSKNVRNMKKSDVVELSLIKKNWGSLPV